MSLIILTRLFRRYLLTPFITGFFLNKITQGSFVPDIPDSLIGKALQNLLYKSTQPHWTVLHSITTDYTCFSFGIFLRLVMTFLPFQLINCLKISFLSQNPIRSLYYQKVILNLFV